MPAARGAITIDYPAPDSIFPPEITAPTFLWRDTEASAKLWRVEITFADGAPPLRFVTRGPRMRVGEIDPDCIAKTNELPKLTPEQAASHTWIPDAASWRIIKQHSVTAPAVVAFINSAGRRAQVRIRTSKDPVGAPIFYRDVPLMPTETEKGVIKPIANEAVRLIAWRARNLAEPRSRVVMSGLPVCANCHSFAANGSTLGMDLDGLKNNKSQYTLTPVHRETEIRQDNVIQWRTSRGRITGSLRAGFMSQVSPDGRYVVTTIDPETNAGSNYYVANFRDYRFLQVFYPTRGVLAWYSRETGILTPLPGADDPACVQMGGVWSPDGKYLVFARARAREPNPPGVPLAQHANDPNETPLQYDLYRIPFNNGAGGKAEPISGASNNGMSNSFPKISPDGHWIVFVQAHNGLLMRPDSRLYVVPAAGGTARPLHANLSRMNSWHSFSPNGRWLAFSSKHRSPYTQLYLTHIDEDGNDSPAILVDNTTAANRAVNLPEFVNVAPDGLQRLGGPAVDFFKLFDRALYLQKNGRYQESVAVWRKVMETRPESVEARGNFAMALMLAGHREEAAREFRTVNVEKLRSRIEEGESTAAIHVSLGDALLEDGNHREALEQYRQAQSTAARIGEARALAANGRTQEAAAILREILATNPNSAAAHYYLGTLLTPAEAIAQWTEALRCDPKYAEAHEALGNAFYGQGRVADALAQWQEQIRLHPKDPAALERVARLLATEPPVRNAEQSLALAIEAIQLAGPSVHRYETLAAAYAANGRFETAAATIARALKLDPGSESLKQQLNSYQQRQPAQLKALSSLLK